jgi:hypothetical protein
MDWKQLLAYSAGPVDHELLLRNEYLVTENHALRQQITSRIHLDDSERKALADFIAGVTPHPDQRCMTQIARKITIADWGFLQPGRGSTWYTTETTRAVSSCSGFSMRRGYSVCRSRHGRQACMPTLSAGSVWSRTKCYRG